MNTLHWGVLGAARIAREQMIPAIRRNGGEVVAVSSASGRSHDFAAELGIGTAHTSHEDLLADPRIEAVYIAVANSDHLRWVEAALQTGRHVLCEKPIAMHADDLARIENARNAGLVLAEAFMYRHHPQLARLRELLDAGAIGEVVTAQARLHFSLDRQLGAGDIRLLPQAGGGALYDVGCYPVDLFSGIFGAEPEELAAIARTDPGGGVDTRFAATLRYGSALAGFDCSFDSPFHGSATVLGTAGRIQLDHVFRADLVGGQARLEITDADGAVRYETISGDSYGAQVEAFQRAVATAATAAPGTDAGWQQTRHTTRTLDRLRTSIRKKDEA